MLISALGAAQCWPLDMLTGDAPASQPPWTAGQGMKASERCVWEWGEGVGSALERPLFGSQKATCSAPT